MHGLHTLQDLQEMFREGNLTKELHHVLQTSSLWGKHDKFEVTDNSNFDNNCKLDSRDNGIGTYLPTYCFCNIGVWLIR